MEKETERMRKLKEIHIYQKVSEHITRTFCLLLSWIFSILIIFINKEPDYITAGCTCLAFSLPLLLEYYFKLNATYDWKIRLLFTFFVLLSFIQCALSVCVIIKIAAIDRVYHWMFFLSTLIIIPFLLDCILLMIFEKKQN